MHVIAGMKRASRISTRSSQVSRLRIAEAFGKHV